jgi:hypothetical protein
MKRWLLSLDVTAVMLFVIAGRNTHDEGSSLSGVIGTAAPFLIALGVAWLVMRAWRTPLSSTTGIGVWAITLVGGMLLRRMIFGDGTAAAFMLVATGFLGATLLGWRFVAQRRTATEPSST